MASDKTTRGMPPADRERDRIAVRHAERRRLRYGSGSKPEDASETAPSAVFLSFSDVVGWIAYGRTTALDENTGGDMEFFNRWHFQYTTDWSGPERRHRLVRDMRRAIARVRWWQRCKRLHRRYTGSRVPALNWRDRATVRWMIRRMGGTTAETLALLKADVRQWLAAQAAHENAVASAIQRLIAEIAARNIVAWGRPGCWRKREFRSGLPEAIPFAYFAVESNTIRLDNWATCADSVTPEEWAKWNGPDWGDVKFEAAEVYRLWPGKAPASNTHVENVMLEDLPPSLTPMQAVAWIATRDAAVVLRASLEPADTARASVALGDTVEWCDDKPGLETISINMRAGQPDATDNAVAALVEALRRGHVIASANPVHPETKAPERRQEMALMDWADLTFAEADHDARQIICFRQSNGRVIRKPEASGWSNVLIGTASLVTKWPEAAEAPVASATPSLSQQRGSKNAGRGTFIGDAKARPAMGAVPVTPATQVAHPAARVPFERSRAKILLMYERALGIFKGRIPTERETKTFLLRTFTGVSNDPHREIRRELWPGNRPGPRRKGKAAE